MKRSLKINTLRKQPLRGTCTIGITDPVRQKCMFFKAQGRKCSGCLNNRAPVLTPDRPDGLPAIAGHLTLREII